MTIMGESEHVDCNTKYVRVCFQAARNDCFRQLAATETEDKVPCVTQCKTVPYASTDVSESPTSHSTREEMPETVENAIDLTIQQQQPTRFHFLLRCKVSPQLIAMIVEH